MPKPKSKSKTRSSTSRVSSSTPPPPRPSRASKPAAPTQAAAPERRPVPCMSCGHCCTYVAIEINPPNTEKRATEMLWYLYHERMSLYEADGDWMLQVETRCRNLGEDRRCGVYETRPHICRDYSEKECEVNSEDLGQTFYTAEEFLAYLRAKRPKLYAKLERGYVPKTFADGKDAKKSPRRLPIFERRFRDLRALGVS